MKTIEILGFKAKVARTFWERARGLIGTKSLAPNEGLLIEKCNAIHMCFMSFPIDAYFLDKDDQVVKVVRNIPPWKLFVWGGRRAVKVLETACRDDAKKVGMLVDDYDRRVFDAQGQVFPPDVVKKIFKDDTLKDQVGASSVDHVVRECERERPYVADVRFEIVFGRSHRADIRLLESDVSGKHVEIVQEGDQFCVVCLSCHGMTVNEERIEHLGRRSLHEGDCMRIGKNTEVRVVRLPKDGDDVMVLNVKDGRGSRDQEVRVVRLPKDGGDVMVLNVRDSRGSRDQEVRLPTCESEDVGELLMCTEKPVIYLYPGKETKCDVKVVTDGALTCTYPAHGADGWHGFVAAPDGTLTFPDGRKFYCLYWEGTTPTRWDFSKGYCVKGADTAVFLADVLAKMGLSFREANELIIYWLPRMQENPYNVIAFQVENYAQSAKLEIEPQPDSILRVFMAWKASDCPVDIPAPEIPPFERKGFTVVEWGGTEVGK